MTDEAPQIPPPPPEVPRGKLWTSLLMPPAVTLIGGLIARAAYSSGSYGTEFLPVLPVGLVAILIGLGIFLTAWRTRYRGRTLVLTCVGYFFGQVILCLGLWFGCCLLSLA